MHFRSVELITEKQERLRGETKKNGSNKLYLCSQESGRARRRLWDTRRLHESLKSVKLLFPFRLCQVLLKHISSVTVGHREL